MLVLENIITNKISAWLINASDTLLLQVIAKAKVPIVKFEEVESGINFDVSFNVANGPEAAQRVRDLTAALPPMQPLMMVLKVFLQQRELNEVYSGGSGAMRCWSWLLPSCSPTPHE